MKFLDTLQSSWVKTKQTAVAYKPEIMLVAGIAGIVAGTIGVCIATVKAQEIIEEEKKNIDQVKNTVDEKGQVNKKDLTIAYGRMAGKVALAYAIPAAVEITAIASIIGADSERRKRNASLCAAYTALGASFQKYRENVKEKYGDEVDLDMMYSRKREQITVEEEDPETGKKKKVKKEVLKQDANGFAFWFGPKRDDGEVNPYYQRNCYLDKLTAVSQVDLINNLIDVKGSATLNDLRTSLGQTPVPEGVDIGWVKDVDDPTFNPATQAWISCDIRNLSVDDINPEQGILIVPNIQLEPVSAHMARLCTATAGKWLSKK